MNSTNCQKPIYEDRINDFGPPLARQIFRISDHPPDIQIYTRALSAKTDFVKLGINAQLSGEIPKLREPLVLMAE